MSIKTLLATFAFTLFTGGALPVLSAVETSIPLSAETGTSIAGDHFPVTIKIAGSNLYLSDPVLQFIDSRRIGLWLRLPNDTTTAWSTQVKDPIRSELPPHPYLIPFRNNIQNILYNGKTISLIIGF